MNKDIWIKYMMERTNLDYNTLSNEYNLNYRPKNVSIYNSAKGYEITKNPTDFMNELLDHQIIVENGTIFNNHDVFEALPVKTILTLVNLRNKFKSLMKQAKSRGDAVATKNYNNSQIDTKIGINTYYGTQLMVTSKFYNSDIGASITARGRGTVSINGLTLESCMGNWRPYSLSALCDMIEKSKNKEVSERIINNCPIPDEEDILSHILGYHGEDYYGKDFLMEKINKLTDEEKIKVYYNSNFKEFINIPYIKNLIRHITTTQNSCYREIKNMDLKDYKNVIYVDPMNYPENIKEYMDDYKVWMTELLSGYYWYEGDINKNGGYYNAPEDIFRDIKRKVVVITDTDSLIFTLKPSMNLIMNNLTKDDYNYIKEEHLNLIIGSLVIFTASYLITLVLDKYTKQSLITDRYRNRISYKQEYVFRTLQTTKAAKNYLGIITSQEGVLLPFEDIDLKGLSLKKSNFNKMLADKARYLAVEMIAKQSTPDISAIINEVNNTRELLSNIFRERDNLDVFTISKLSTGYDDTPLGEYRMKAVMLYNTLFNDKINLPGAFLICNIDLESMDEEYVSNKYPGYIEKLQEVADFRTIFSTKSTIQTKANNMFGIETADGVVIEDEYIKSILEGINEENDVEGLKNYITSLKKNIKHYEELENSNKIIEFIRAIGMKNIKIKDIDKIALPLDNETVPEFISDHIDMNEIGVYENLISVIISGLGLTVIRNKNNRQIIHNIVSYY